MNSDHSSENQHSHIEKIIAHSSNEYSTCLLEI